MVEILTLMTPIFLMIGMGAGFVRFGAFPASGLPTLNRFLMNACIPALMFCAVTGGGALGDFAFGKTLVYGAASLTSALCLILMLRIGLGEPSPQSIVLGLGGSVSNSVFLGFPIAAMLIPDRAASVFSWVVLAEILFVIPLLTTLALWAEQRGARLSPGAILLPLLRSPVTLGLGAGFAFLASGLALPGPIEKVTQAIVQAAPFLALFLIGGMLTQARITRVGPSVGAITIAKLGLHPLLAGIAFSLMFGWDNQATRDAMLFAAIPTLTIFAVFAGRHGAGEIAASAVAATTLAGAVTVTAMLTFITTL